MKGKTLKLVEENEENISDLERKNSYAKFLTNRILKEDKSNYITINNFGH